MATRRRPVVSETPEPEYEVDTSKEAPAGPRKPSKAAGWGSSSSSGDTPKAVQAPYLDLREGTHIVKILNDAPTVRYLQHFVGQGKPPVTCFRSDTEVAAQLRAQSLAESDGKVECALCEKGAQPSYGYLLNVVDLTDDPTVVRKWTFGKTVKDTLMSLIEDPITSPLDREFDEDDRYRPIYWKIRQTKGDGGKRIVHITPLKLSDLIEDYGLKEGEDIPSTEEVEALAEKSWGEETLFYPYVAKMKTLAAAWTAPEK